MNNYEKRLLLKYFDKMLCYMDFDRYSFDTLFEMFLKEFSVDKSLFNFNRRGFLVADKSKKFICQVKKIIKDLNKTIPDEETVFKKQLSIIKNIYNLDKFEISILEYFAIQNTTKMFEDFFDCLEGSKLNIFAKTYLGIDVCRVNRIKDDLYLKKLLKSYHGDIEIHPDLIEVFDNPKCDTEAKIVDVLVGDCEKSTLQKIDFEHIKQKQSKAVKILKAAVKKKQKGVNILLYGGVGVGKTEFAKLTANLASVPIYAVKTESDKYREAKREERLFDLYSKQYMLSATKKSCILFDEAEDVMNRGFSYFGSASKGYMNKVLEDTPVPVIWTTNNISDVDPAFLRRMTYAIEFEKLSDEKRLDIWKKVLKKNDFKVNSKKLKELNKTYDISPSLIANAVQSTKLINGNENDFEDFIENVARVVTKKKNVKNNKKDFEVKDYNINLVNTDIQMDELTEKIKKAKKLNFSLCLYGEPGTGKSQYARYLANILGIEVVQKRASDLISKWVGETEENIANAFEEAKNKKAMLIFDEADSFLQNRNNAQRSWEISQVNEMLTWMESHEYPFVCTTNLLDTLDEASLRRFTFKIKFDFMTSQQVNSAIEHFFEIKNADLNIKGLTTGDFVTVRKKADFLGINNLNEVAKMLMDEVKVKKSKELQKSIGF